VHRSAPCLWIWSEFCSTLGIHRKWSWTIPDLIWSHHVSTPNIRCNPLIIRFLASNCDLSGHQQLCGSLRKGRAFLLGGVRDLRDLPTSSPLTGSPQIPTMQIPFHRGQQTKYQEAGRAQLSSRFEPNFPKISKTAPPFWVAGCSTGRHGGWEPNGPQVLCSDWRQWGQPWEAEMGCANFGSAESYMWKHYIDIDITLSYNSKYWEFRSGSYVWITYECQIVDGL